MRKNVVALGISLLFLGAVFIAVSRVTVKPEPLKTWTVVSDFRAETPTTSLVVQGNLVQRDRFRVYFGVAPVSGPGIPWDAAVLINFTDPNGNTRTYEIEVRLIDDKPASADPPPEGVVNHTGTYKVDAWAIWGISLDYLALQKIEIKEMEPQHPYGNLFFVGGAIFLGGIGAVYLGVKAPRRKRRFIKRHFTKRKY